MSDLPSSSDDYTVTNTTELTAAVCNAIFNSIGARLRALEGVEASFQALIDLGTSQALASIAANVEPELVAARAALTQLQADTALAQDVVAAIVSGSVPLTSVDGLVAALAAKATPADIATAIEALEGGASTALDTLGELAAALGDDANFASTVTAALAARLRVDAAQALTTAQAIQGRANLGVSGKASRRNRHLNPAFQICQDRATGSTVSISATGYVMDGVIAVVNGGGVLSCSQVAKATPGGSRYRSRFAVSTADTTIAAGSVYDISLPIEGVNVNDLMWGTAAAKSFVWRGVVNLPAGSYGLSFANGAGTRSYAMMFVVPPAEAGTDKLVTVTVPGDMSGTWITDSSGAGIVVRLCIAAGSTYQTTVTGSWQSGNWLTTAAQTNTMSSTSNVTELCDIGLYDGSELPDWEMSDYVTDLAACSWLYRPVGAGWNGFEETETSFSVTFDFPLMRTVPSMVLISTAIVMRYAPVGDRTIYVTSIGALSPTRYGAWVVFNCSGGNVAGRVIADRLGTALFFANARL